MNIFVIPSWYPSADYPVSGIMIKEQFEALCRMEPSAQIGISLWGQKENKYLISVKDHFKNIPKLLASTDRATITEVLPNLKVYRKPAFTWTQQVAQGNLKGIVKANLHNLKAFEAHFGPVQLLHVQAAQPAGLVAMEVSKATGIPYCITERMGPFPSIYATDKSGNLSKTYQDVYQNAVANIAVSPYQAGRMRKYYIPNVRVIPDFTVEDYFKPVATKRTTDFTFFALGRIEQLKGMRELVEAMALVNQQNKAITLRIGGLGPLTGELTQLAKELEVSAQIEWLGYLNRENVLSEMQNCQAFVLPSHYESFGVSYTEALACGKPIIATKCGGPESIVNTVNGILVEKQNPQELAEAMLEMVSNYECYNPELIRQDFLDRFSAKAVVPQMMACYKEILCE